MAIQLGRTVYQTKPKTTLSSILSGQASTGSTQLDKALTDLAASASTGASATATSTQNSALANQIQQVNQIRENAQQNGKVILADSLRPMDPSLRSNAGAVQAQSQAQPQSTVTSTTTYFDVDSSLTDVYNQAKSAGVTLNKPKSYGQTITSQAAAQKIVNDYTNTANTALAKKSGLTSVNNGGASASTVYDISQNVKDVQSQAAKYGVSVSLPKTTSYKSQSEAQKALDSFVTSTNAALSAKAQADIASVKSTSTAPTSNWDYQTEYNKLSSRAKKMLNDDNAERKAAGKGLANPAYYAWLADGTSFEAYPPHEWSAQIAESPAQTQAREAANAKERARVLAIQNELQAEYEATQKAAGTTHAKNTTPVTNNGLTGSQLIAKAATVKQTTKATIIPASSPTVVTTLQKLEDHTGQVQLKDGTWIDQVQKTGASNPSSGVVTVFTESTKEHAVNVAKAAQDAYNTYQTQRSNFKEAVDKNGNTVAAIQQQGSNGTGEANVRVINTDKAGNITAISGSGSDYTKVLQQQQQSLKIHDAEYDREVAANAKLQQSSNPIIREYAKLDKALSDYTMGLATDVMTGAQLAMGNKVSEADLKHLQSSTGIGTAKTYSNTINNISTKYGNATLFNEKSVQGIADTLKQIEDYAANGIVNAIPTQIRDSIGNVSNGIKNNTSNAFTVFAGNVVKSVENSDKILPNILVAANGIPQVAVSALKEGETLYKNKGYILPTLAYGAGAMVAGTVKSAYEDPVETAAYFVVQDAALRGTLKGLEAAAKTTGMGTGLVRGSLHVVDSVKNGDIIPLKSKGSIVETLLTQEKVSGARAVDVPTSKTVLVRKPIAEQEAHATVESAFMTLKTGDVNTVSDYFFNKNGKSVLKQRVFELDDIQTAKLPADLKAEIRQSITDTGQFKTQYKEVERLAQLQADKTGQPVAIPSPKTAIGHIEQENEVSLVFPRDAKRSQIKLGNGETASLYKVSSSSLAGVTRSGVVVKKLSFSDKKPPSVIKNITDNLKHNYDIGIDKYGVFNKADQRAVMVNALQREQEIYEGALRFENSFEYGKHGVEHTENVISNLKTLNKTHDIGADYEYLTNLGKYHDITKIGAHDLAYGGEHAISGARAVRSGELKGLKGYTQAELNKLADDIAKHTKIQPVAVKSPIKTSKFIETVPSKQKGKIKTHESLKIHNPIHKQNPLTGLKTKFITRPSTEAKMLATADRMDLTRFGMEVDKSKIFKFGDDTARARLSRTLDSLESQFKGSRFVSDTTAELFPRHRPVKTLDSESVTRMSGYKLGEKSDYVIGSGYARSLSAQESLMSTYKSEYSTTSGKSGYYATSGKAGKSYSVYSQNGKSGKSYAPSGSKGYSAPVKSGKYYPVTSKKNYTASGKYKPVAPASYRAVTSSEYKPPQANRYTAAGKKYTPKGNGYTPNANHYTKYTTGKTNYPPNSGYTSKDGYTPIPSGYSSGGSGGSGKGGYGVAGGGHKSTTVFFGRKRRGEEALLAKKKKKQQIEVKNEKDMAKIKRLIVNKLGGLESMLGETSKRTTRKTTKRRGYPF